MVWIEKIDLRKMKISKTVSIIPEPEKWIRVCQSSDYVIARAQPETISYFTKEKAINSKKHAAQNRMFALSPKDYRSG